jgi:hypothetical protein
MGTRQQSGRGCEDEWRWGSTAPLPPLHLHSSSSSPFPWRLGRAWFVRPIFIGRHGGHGEELLGAPLRPALRSASFLPSLCLGVLVVRLAAGCSGAPATAKRPPPRHQDTKQICLLRPLRAYHENVTPSLWGHGMLGHQFLAQRPRRLRRGRRGEKGNSAALAHARTMPSLWARSGERAPGFRIAHPQTDRAARRLL